MKRIILALTIVNIYAATDSVALRENIVNIVGNSKNLLELNNNIKNLVLTGNKQLISSLYSNGLEIILSYLQNNFKNEFSTAADSEILGGIKELTDKKELANQNLDYRYLINASKDSNSEFYNKYLKSLIFLINYFNLKPLKQLLTYNQVNTISMRLPIQFPLDYINRDFIYWLNNNFNNQIPSIDSRDRDGDPILMDGDTALTFASFNGYKEIVELLINAGADTDSKDENRYTALMWASYRGYKEIVELLINAKANINIQNKNGNTAIMWASTFGHKEIVELLLNAGANPNIHNKDGDTAIMWAHEYKEIIELLNRTENNSYCQIL